MFKQTYDSMNERLAPESRLVEDTLRRMADRRRGVRWVGPVKPRRFATAALALVLVLCISLTAAVAAAPSRLRAAVQTPRQLRREASAYPYGVRRIKKPWRNGGWRRLASGTQSTRRFR